MQFGIFNSSKKWHCNLQWECTVCHTLEIQSGTLLSISDPLGIICLPYQFSWMLLVLPASLMTLVPQLSPPKQMYLVILLLKMPQWWPVVSTSLLYRWNVNSQPGIDRLSTHLESMAPPNPHLFLLTACTPPSMNVNYALQKNAS